MQTYEWLECKEPCADCPLDTTRTAKKDCLHIWRHLVRDIISESGEVPFDTPERAHALGATVCAHRGEDGSRPSLHLFTEEPARKFGFIVAKIREY